MKKTPTSTHNTQKRLNHQLSKHMLIWCLGIGISLGFGLPAEQAGIWGLGFPPKAAAQSVEQIGGGIPGIAEMWDGITAFLPSFHRGAGSSGIFIAARIVINTVLWAIGSAAVLIILYASIRMVTSGGNEETVRKAWKEMIFYACLGLIFAILADTIVNYVIAIVSGIAAS